MAGDDKDIQGEGDYRAARRFDEAEAKFVKSGKVEAGAKAAKAAVEGPENAELEAARLASARGESVKPKKS